MLRTRQCASPAMKPFLSFCQRTCKLYIRWQIRKTASFSASVLLVRRQGTHKSPKWGTATGALFHHRQPDEAKQYNIPTTNMQTHLANVKQSISTHDGVFRQQTAFSDVNADQWRQPRHYLHNTHLQFFSKIFNFLSNKNEFANSQINVTSCL